MLLDIPEVDQVEKNTADSKTLIELIKPDIIFIGSDWATKDYYKQMQFTQEWLDERKIALCYIPYYKLLSTSKIIERANV